MSRDIVGAQDIVGANYARLDNLFGYGGLAVGAEAGPELAQQIAARRAALVVEREVSKARVVPLGFPTTAVAAGANADIQTQPQTLFRAQRLVIPSDIAGAVLVRDLRIGARSVLPNANPVPGRMFTETTVGGDMNLDTAQVSQIITLSITNTSAAAITFNAGIYGTMAE